MPPKPKIAVGARVSLKSSKSSDKYGTVVKASARREWLITWDKPMKTDSVQRGGALVVHPPGTGLVTPSPADGEDGSNDVALVNEDPNEAEDGNPNIEPEDLNTTSQKRKRFEDKRKDLFGKSVEFSRKAKAGEGGGLVKEVEWKFVDPDSINKVDISGVPGRRGWSDKKQVKVLRNFTINSYSPTNLLDLYRHLWPGDIQKQLGRINAQARLREGDSWVSITEFEFFRFVGLMIGAVLTGVIGVEALFSPSEEGLFMPSINFSEYMTLKRFKQVKRYISEAFANRDLLAENAWAMFDDAVSWYNENRKQNIIRSPEIIGDESMSQFAPQTTKKGGLPNISYIQRKPRPLGTEFKDTCDALTSMMLHLEIQKGEEAQQEMEFAGDVDKHGRGVGVLAATGLRLALASV
jgi:hypothetical protein